MSRAYRVRIAESISKIIRASDHVSTHLELLEILPAEEMTELLEEELSKEGFEKNEEGQLEREQNGVTVVIDPKTAKVTVKAEAAQDVDLETEAEGRGYDDMGPSREQVEEKLRKQAREQLEEEAGRKTEDLQKEVTDKLEGELSDIQDELGKAVNRVTGEALKRKASRMGQIKDMTQDPESGSMTIVVEV